MWGVAMSGGLLMCLKQVLKYVEYTKYWPDIRMNIWRV